MHDAGAAMGPVWSGPDQHWPPAAGVTRCLLHPTIPRLSLDNGAHDRRRSAVQRLAGDAHPAGRMASSRLDRPRRRIGEARPWMLGTTRHPCVHAC